jgi:WD40 repeat protein
MRAIAPWIALLVLACGEPAPAPVAPAPAPAEPTPLPIAAPDPPPPPTEPQPRLRIGTGHFFSPSAVRAIVVSDRIYVARDGERVEVWTRDGVLDATFELAAPEASTIGIGGLSAHGGITALDVRGDRIAVALGGHGARVLSRSDGRELFALRDLDMVHDVALLPDGGLVSAHGGEAFANGDMIVEAHGACGLCFWSSTGERTFAVPRDEAGGWVTSIAASDDGAIVVTGASDGRLRVYDAHGARTREIRTGDRRIDRVALVDGARSLLYADDVGGVARVGIDGTGRRAITAADELFEAAALGDARIAWAGELGGVRIFDGAGARAASFALDGVSALALDGEDVLVGDLQGHLRVWHDGAFASREDPRRAIEQVFYDDTGDHLWVRSGTELRVYRATDGALESGPRALPEFVGTIAPRAGGRLLVQRNAISLGEEDLDGSHPAGAGSGNGSSINHVVVSRDRRVFAYSTSDRVRVGATSLRVEDGVRALALSDDGASVAVTTQGATPRLFVADVATGTERWSVVLGSIGSVLAWSGDVIAVAAGGNVELRAASDGAVRATASGVGSEGVVPSTLALSPDASLLAVALDDGAVLLIDAAHGAVRWRVAAHRGPATSLAFHPSGRELASAGADGTVLVWPVSSD